MTVVSGGGLLMTAVSMWWRVSDDCGNQVVEG